MTDETLVAPARKLTEKTIVGLGWTSLAMGAQAILQMVALIVLARLLEPQQFGLFAAAMVIAGFCTIFSELGVGPAIVQRPVLEPRHIRAGTTLSVSLSLAAGLAVYVWAPFIADFFQMPGLTNVVRIMALAFPLQGLSTVAQSLALRSLRFRWLALIDAGAFAMGFVVVAPILTLMELGIYALVGAFLTQNVVRAAVLLVGQPHDRRPLVELRAFRELLYFGAGFTMARVGNFFAGQADNIVVGRWLGPIALGLYANAYQLMVAPAMLVGQVLDRVLFPTMASVQFQPERLIRAYRSGVFVCALVMLPSSIVIAILAEEIVLVLLGPSWADVALPLRILAFGMLFRTSYKMSDTIVRATGAVYARAWRQAIFAAAVFLGALVGQHWGLAGVATGVLVALGVNFGMMAQLSLRLIGMRWGEFGQAHLPGLLLAVVLGAGSYGTALWLRGADVAPVLVLLGVCFAAVALAPMLVWIRPAIFLGPDSVQILRALSNLAPLRMRPWFVGHQQRVSE